MGSIDTDITKGFESAAIAGDVAKFRALAQQFPRALEALRDERLVDLAVANRQPEMTIELVVRHGFEVSHEFETMNVQYGGELRAEGVDQIHRTLEVLADAVLGYPNPKGRSLSCHALRHELSEYRLHPARHPIHEAFLRCVNDGTLDAFVAKTIGDERFGIITNRHTGLMVKAFESEKARLVELASALPPPETAHGNGTAPLSL